MRASSAIIYRVAQRERIHLGVILDLIHTDRCNAKAALAQAETLMRDQGADAILFLDGCGSAVTGILRDFGYRLSHEQYSMLVWPKTMVPPSSPATDLANWRFSFLDHDAF